MKGLGNLSKISNLKTSVQSKAGVSGAPLEVHPDELYSVEQIRKDFDADYLQSLGHDMQTNGQETPIVVYPKDERGYRISSGEQRWRGAKMVDMKAVKIVIDPSLSLEDRDGEKVMSLKSKIRQGTDNIHRKDLNPLEISIWINELISDYGMTKGEIAQRSAFSPSWVSRHIKLATAPEYIKTVLRNGTLQDAATATELVKLHALSAEVAKELVASGEITRPRIKEEADKIKKPKLQDQEKGVDIPTQKEAPNKLADKVDTKTDGIQYTVEDESIATGNTEDAADYQLASSPSADKQSSVNVAPPQNYFFEKGVLIVGDAETKITKQQAKALAALLQEWSGA